jgi:hypothetical protein
VLRLKTLANVGLDLISPTSNAQCPKSLQQFRIQTSDCPTFDKKRAELEL